MGKKEKSKRVVLVEWVDSRSPTSEWEFLEDKDFPEIVNCISVGFLLKKDQAQVILASNLGDLGKDEQVMGIMTISTCSITKLVDLKG
jgi:hypothetical protein